MMKVNVKRLLVGIGIGVSIGLLLRPSIEQKKLTPEKALKLVKKTVSQTHKITGSWIHMIPEQVTRQNTTYEVYRGGISAKEGDDTKQYEFLVDRATGTLLDLIAS